jgi:hypothetical protein
LYFGKEDLSEGMSTSNVAIFDFDHQNTSVSKIGKAITNAHTFIKKVEEQIGTDKTINYLFNGTELGTDYACFIKLNPNDNVRLHVKFALIPEAY